jgi:hypothetical protein
MKLSEAQARVIRLMREGGVVFFRGEETVGVRLAGKEHIFDWKMFQSLLDRDVLEEFTLQLTPLGRTCPLGDET